MMSETDTELGRQISRVIEDGFFPTSPAATLRESIFSEILAGVLGASPTTQDLDELREAFESHDAVDDAALADEVWDVFLATYTTTGERGARGKKAKRYVIPFHPTIAKCIEPHETRNWGEWYRMLMTSGDPPSFEQELHEEFVERLDALEPSNLFEQVFVDVARNLGFEEEGETATQPLRPYVDDCARVFQNDLRRCSRVVLTASIAFHSSGKSSALPRRSKKSIANPRLIAKPVLGPFLCCRYSFTWFRNRVSVAS